VTAAAGVPPRPTRRAGDADELHGELVADPYRWLEDTDSAETRAWIEEQNAATRAVLDAVPSRPALRCRLEQLWDHPRRSVPFERGGRWFQRRNSGLQNQPVLAVVDPVPGPDGRPVPGDPNSPGRVLLDPNALSEDGTVAAPTISVSRDGALLAYATSSAGSDWVTWRVRDVASGEDRADVLAWSKFGGAEWLADGSGFFYSAEGPPPPGKELLARSSAPRIMLHVLGTDQAEDEVVVDHGEHPDWLPHAVISEDGRFLVVTISRGTGREHRIDIVDLDSPERRAVTIVPGFTDRAEVVANVGETFFLVTDRGAERRRLVALELDAPGPEQWREVVPEREALLLDARLCGGTLVCHHLEHACSRLSVVALDGAALRQLPLPAVTSVTSDADASFVEGRAESTVFHFGLTSFVDPGSLWSHDLASGETRQVWSSEAPIDPAGFVSTQVVVPADDGAELRLFLTHLAGTEPAGDVPALLYGYGGFDIPMTPSFSRFFAAFVERGGLLAVAVLRGGGEYGRAWHDAGRLANKQRVFDDFACCARFLAASGWSCPERIAINGGSNGGLLVGACLTQHPELIGAAVPEVGVLDMLRFHRFTIGWAWTSDFGDPEDAEQYRWLRAYSPLHNIRPGVAYPATLVVTGDHDDRVVPGHSFKFAATLQDAQRDVGGAAPILVRIETSAGHGLGKPVSKSIDERADVLAFLELALGMS
jgi:prolyl oligopeptidase